MMNLEQAALVAEIFGGLTVLVTLDYLAIQIRQSSRMMKANAKQNIADATQQLFYKMLEETKIRHKLINGGDFKGIEHAKAWMLTRAMLRGYEAQIYQFEVGLLDEAEWANLKHVIKETAAYPGFRSMLPLLSESVSPQLREVIEESRDERVNKGAE